MSAVVSATVAGVLPGHVAASEGALEQAEGTQSARSPVTLAPGVQPGITTPLSTSGIVAGFQIIVGTQERLEQLFRSLDHEIRVLAAGEAGIDALPLDPRRRASNSGELGFDEVTGTAADVMVAYGPTLFGGGDLGPDRFGLAGLRPKDLTLMPSFPGDALDPAGTDSDLFVQIGAAHPMVALHALRHLERRLRWGLELKFAHQGFGLYPGSGQPAPRALLGYHDGTNNLHNDSIDDLRAHVWVQPEDQEPAWALGGTYVVFRRIRELLELWDRESGRQQDAHFGRRKLDGVALANPDGLPTDPHDYADDPSGRRTPLAAHIRRANPRRPGDEASRILRRSFAYVDGDAGNTIDAGVLFMAFQRSIAKQFATVKRRLEAPDDPALGEGPQTLSEYLRPIGGGYYFVPPAPLAEGEFLGQRLLLAGGFTLSE